MPSKDRSQMQQTTEIGYETGIYDGNEAYETITKSDNHYQEVVLNDLGDVKHVVYKEKVPKKGPPVPKIKFKEYKICDRKTKICTVVGGFVIIAVAISMYFLIVHRDDLKFLAGSNKKTTTNGIETVTPPILSEAKSLMVTFQILNIQFHSNLESVESPQRQQLEMEIEVELARIIADDDLLTGNLVDIQFYSISNNMAIQAIYIFKRSFKITKMEEKVKALFLENTRTSPDWNLYLGEYIVKRDTLSFLALEDFVPATLPSSAPVQFTTTSHQLDPLEITTTSEKPCEEIVLTQCSNLSYQAVQFPNMYGHSSQKEVFGHLESSLKTLLVSSCHHQVSDMLCHLLLPPCVDDGNPDPPCSELCMEFVNQCGVFSPSWLIENINCATFPAVDSTIKCIQSKDISKLQVELVDSQSPKEGKVLVQYGDQKGYICDHGFSDIDAEVVCRHMNITFQHAIAKPGSYFGKKQGQIIIDSLNCIGNENLVDQCQYTIGSDKKCQDDVGVQCFTDADLIDSTTTNLPTSKSTTNVPSIVRLSDGPSDKQGRVEVYMNETWGTICKNMFNDNAASVVCKMLGFNGGSYEFSRYGSGSGAILMNNVYCFGSENSIFVCFHEYPSSGECSHIHDVSISCK